MESFEIYTRALTIVHLTGVILGVGGATITDILFLRFLADTHISQKEAKIMDVLSKIIWIAFCLLVVTGIFLYLLNIDRLNESGKFLTKLIGLLVLVINGLILRYWIRPKLTRIDFSEGNKPRFGLSAEVNRQWRRFATVAGAISISSWYFIFILGALRGINFPFIYGISAYIFVLCCAILGGLLHESGAFQKRTR